MHKFCNHINKQEQTGDDLMTTLREYIEYRMDEMKDKTLRSYKNKALKGDKNRMAGIIGARKRLSPGSYTPDTTEEIPREYLKRSKGKRGGIPADSRNV
jgi:hypothetical protein